MINYLLRFANSHRGLTKFLGVGSINTLVDLVLFFVLANILEVFAPIASIISTGLTLILSFFLNHHFVFRSQKKRRSTAFQFILITLFNVWVIQTSIIWIVVHILDDIIYFDTHEWSLNLLAKLCGVSVSFVLNFLGYRYIFKTRDLEDRNDK